MIGKFGRYQPMDSLAHPENSINNTWSSNRPERLARDCYHHRCQQEFCKWNFSVLAEGVTTIVGTSHVGDFNVVLPKGQKWGTTKLELGL